VLIKSSFVSRATPRNTSSHVVLGVVGYKPREFAAQMNLNLSNGWGIVRTIVDMCMKMPEGKYVLVKDPNKSVIRLYDVPAGTFEEDDEGTVASGQKDGAQGKDDEEGEEE
jgi:translation initiation factor 3 subunit D